MIRLTELSTTGYAKPLLLLKGLLALLLVAWMAVSLSNVFWRLLPQPALETVSVVPEGAAFIGAKATSLPPVDINALKGISLFGEESPVEAPAVAEDVPVKEDVEETSLNLELVGSFANNDQSQAYAIIANGKQQELYRVGEEIEGLSNVKLVSVFVDKVILNNRGRQEALLMYPEGQPLSSGSLVSSELGSIESEPDDNAADSGEEPVAIANLNTNERLEKISDAIRFSRKTESGKMVGFRVLPGRNRAAFEQTGLQLNDVVTAIDGQPLDNLKAANEVYQEKRNATKANLTVLRGTEELTIDVDLNNIKAN